MIIIVGLGNPVDEYGQTRHNAGFLLLDELVKKIDATVWKHQKLYEQCSTTVDETKVVLVKPSTYMNVSGVAVATVLKHYPNQPLADVWVVYDDVTVPLGSFRVRPVGGSSGGHNGIKSVIEQVGSGEFGRIRVGIGPVPENSDLAKYVLRRPPAGERERLGGVLDALSDYVIASIRYQKLTEETIHV